LRDDLVGTVPLTDRYVDGSISMLVTDVEAASIVAFAMYGEIDLLQDAGFLIGHADDAE
jgi:hypothetical protein